MFKKYLAPLALSIAALSLISAAPSLQTQPSATPDIVVELFTSQGCSSCPPANAFTAELSNDPEKLILTYGVTYWDYLGWKDTFGKTKFTERQRGYGQALQIGNVYTPQMVLNGAAHSPRYSRKDVETMPLMADRPLVRFANGADGLSLSLPQNLSYRDVRIALVTYVPGPQAVDVSKGENRGRTLHVANVVTDVKVIVPKSGPVIRTGIQTDAHHAYAGLIHDAKSGKIITAARYTP